VTNVFSTFREAIVIYENNTKSSKIHANYHTLAVNENGVISCFPLIESAQSHAQTYRYTLRPWC